METKEYRIRTATAADAAELLSIYSPYVTDTAITFEYDVPPIEEFRNRILSTQKKYPYLVAESGCGILGYAYAGSFNSRPAYDWSAEVTIYIQQNLRRQGIGGNLYCALETALSAMHILNLYACVAYPEALDEHLTKDSVAFHKHCGYSILGRFHKCGYKFGKWYDMVWMEKFLGNHPDHPAPVNPYVNA
jgi:L-amino acid N-acyltransferase YncA